MRFHPLDESGKFTVSADAVEAICRGWLGSAAGVDAAVELAGGLYNSTFRLELDGREPVVLRIAPPATAQHPSERGLMRNEYASIPFLRPIAPMMPTTLVADFTHDVLDRDYLIQTYLPGVAAAQLLGDWPTEDHERFWNSLGTVLARIHSVRSDRFGRVVGPTHELWSRCLMSVLGDIAQSCEAQALDASDLREVALHVDRLSDTLDEITSAHLLHGDLIPGNVMVDPHDPGAGVTGVFDCDRSWWGDPLADWTFVFVDRLPQEQQHAFWDGYGHQRPELPRERTRGLIYRARAMGEVRLEHARLGRSRQLQKTYPIMAELLHDIRAG